MLLVDGRTADGRADGRRLEQQVLLDVVHRLGLLVVVEVGTGDRRLRHSQRRTIIWQTATDVVRPLIILRLQKSYTCTTEHNNKVMIGRATIEPSH